MLASCVFAAALTNAMAATPGDATISLTENISAQCKSGDCTGFIKGSASISHEVGISALEEQDFDETTTVTVDVDGDLAFPIRLADDPNFQNGDKSANVNSVVPILDGQVNAKLNAQLKWSDGLLTIKLKASFAGDADLIKLKSLQQSRQSKTAKDVNTVDLRVNVENISVGQFKTQREVPCDEKQLFSGFESATGDTSLKEVFSIKSKQVAP